MPQADGSILIDTQLKTDGIQEGIDQISHSIKGLQNLVNKVKGAAAFTALSAAIYKVAESTEALENSIRKASTLFGDVNVNVDNLRTRIRQLSSDTGIAAEEIGNALYEALSSGVPASEDMSEAMEFLRSSAEAAKGGFADLSGTVTATAAVLNAYGMSVSEADRVQGVLMQTQNKGMTTIGQLASSLARVIPTAASFGVSLEQIGASLATTTAAGTQTAEAVTGLNSLLSELGKQGMTGAESLADASEAAGKGRKTFQQLTSEGMNLSDILSMMQEYAEENGKTLIDMFGSVEAGRTALQLAGENAVRFSENLESMYDTAGLVSSAAETVTTNTERLGKAIKNAGSTVGGFFEPVVQDAAGVLADMINSLTGNRDRAKEVETAFDNLISASEELKTAQENAKESTDELTASLEAQASATYHSSLLTFVESYNKEADELDAVRDKIQEKYDGIERDTATFNEIMAKYGEDFAYGDAWAAWEQGLGSVDLERQFGISGEDIQLWHDCSAAVLAYNADVENLRLEEERLAKTWNEYAAKMTESVRTGKVGLSDLMAADYELYESVVALNEIYTTTFENVRENAEGLSLEELRKGIEEATTAISEGHLTNAEYEEQVAKIDALQARYTELTGKEYVVNIETKTSGGGGTAPTTSTQVITPKFDASAIKSAEQVMSEFYAKIRDNGAMKEVFGEDFNEAEANINAVQSALNTLINDFDMGPANAEVQELMGYLEDLEGQTDDAAEGLKKMAAELLAYAESAAQGFAQSIGSGIETLVTDLMTIDEQVEALNEELGDAQAEQLERDQELAEAEEEYRLALLEGNQSEIDAALASLEAAEESKKAQDEKVKSLKDEIKATEDGTKAWESFGKSALLALADVLEGLGAQLAAQAVAQMVAWNWANAAIATAGSVAAYVAAGLVRGWAGKYAEGGIVPQIAGVPSTGDQHIARVNPGELILNEAQQENLASLLTAQQALLDYRASEEKEGHRQIVVEISGDVYGLDSEEVGRAVYRNIRSLQEEGRIDRWR